MSVRVFPQKSDVHDLLEPIPGITRLANHFVTRELTIVFPRLVAKTIRTQPGHLQIYFETCRLVGC